MVTVYEIVPGSPADKAGIKAGDALHTVNGHEIKDVLEDKKSVIKNVFDLMPVYGVKCVPGFDTRFFSERAGNYFIHGYHNGKLL